MRGLFILNSDAYTKIYGPEERCAVDELVEVYAPPLTAAAVRARLDVLADAEVILSGWGMIPLDETVLAAAPKLKAVFYGAGSIRYFTTDAFWDRDIVVTSAYAGNAQPVMEYTVAAVLFSLKRGWYFARAVRELHGYPLKGAVPGGYGSTIGLIGLGMIGRMVARHLRQFDLHLLAYDPLIGASDAAALGVELCSIDEIFRRAHVVSLHAPWLKETVGMITGAHLASMQPNATFVNTARGALVREDEMIAVLQQRPDLQAVLDVVYPEPPPPDSPLYTLPNVVLTPHIAGSMGDECRRMGRIVADELRRFVRGEPLQWQVSRAQAQIMA
ncbi:MAG: hydroxyacid dehydrogenase [Caldilineaceae bacterium]|nr:hydroxyacid dehydrogenase [Caldilineaceae bacterium]